MKQTMLIKHDWKDICRALCVKKRFCQVVKKNNHKRTISQGKKHLSRTDEYGTMQNVYEQINVTVQQGPWQLLEVTVISPGLIFECGDAQIYKKLNPELSFEGTKEHPTALF